MADKSDAFVNDGEKLEDLLHGKLKIIQKEKGYRFSVDPLLLADFVQVEPGDTVVDLGTGSGVLPLILAERTSAQAITGVEIQEVMSHMAQRSVDLNNLTERIRIVTADVKKMRSVFDAESFDVVLSNPPYVPLSAGRVNPQKEKAIARHEVEAQLDDVVAAARYLAKQKGRLYLVYPASRCVDLLVCLRNYELEPKEIQFVHANENSAAKLMLIKAVKTAGPEVTVHKPLYIYNLEGDYTDEASEILENGKSNSAKSTVP